MMLFHTLLRFTFLFTSGTFHISNHPLESLYAAVKVNVTSIVMVLVLSFSMEAIVE